MKFVTAFGAALLGLGIVTSASAADLPRKAPAYVAPIGYNWTGFYLGVNAGYGWTSGFGAMPTASSAAARSAATGKPWAARWCSASKPTSRVPTSRAQPLSAPPPPPPRPMLLAPSAPASATPGIASWCTAPAAGRPPQRTEHHRSGLRGLEQ